ncbi:MAG: hypothetical protein ACRDB9_10280 [Cetobacterium sp.]
MRINEFVKQKTSDEDFQSFKELIQPIALAYQYVMIGKKSITIDTIDKMQQNLDLLKPLLEEYVTLKELSLGKSRILFSEKEKSETLKDMEKIYQNLKKEGIVY